MKLPAKPQKLAIVTLVYWVLLTYMVAALLWWFIALEKLNRNITQIRLSELHKDDPAYFVAVEKIEEAQKRKTTQYLGEGVTFLVLIVLGAIFVFRATSKQLKLSRQQQNFMMAITHELKTPIAITQLNLETLQKRKLDEDKQQKLITNTLQEASRLNILCNNILLAAQLDAGAYRSNPEEINFTDLVSACVNEFKNRFPQRVINESIREGVYVLGEYLLLQMLVNNLIENALKYSPKDAAIKVLVTESDNKVRLLVSDPGMGIPDSEKKKVFEKFYRTGDETTRRTKGTGLGLYLCKKIAETHKANISVTDNLPTGTSFAVIFG
jgi:signal transduction histidine kinase